MNCTILIVQSLYNAMFGGHRNGFIICLFVWFDSLRPINNLSVKQGQAFLGWTSTKLMYLAQGPQRSDAGEARTHSPLVSSQALYSMVECLIDRVIVLDGEKNKKKKTTVTDELYNTYSAVSI